MKFLIKSVLSVVIIAAAGNSFSQSYTLSPGDSVQFTGVFDHLQTLSIEQVNATADTIQLAWKKVSESVPPNWEAVVCDNVMCNTSLVDSGSMNPVMPGDYGFVLMHITPHVNYGTAVVRYAVWDIANDSMKDTLTYILSLDSVSAISENKTVESFQLFPNPANSGFNVKTELHNGFTYTVIDLNGDEVLKGVSSTNYATVSTMSMECGMYTVTMYAKDKMVSNKIISIQH